MHMHFDLSRNDLGNRRTRVNVCVCTHMCAGPVSVGLSPLCEGVPRRCWWCEWADSSWGALWSAWRSRACRPAWVHLCMPYTAWKGGWEPEDGPKATIPFHPHQPAPCTGTSRFTS